MEPFVMLSGMKNQNECKHPQKFHPEHRLLLNKWYDEGHIISFTPRTEVHRAYTETWLKNTVLNTNGMLMGKPMRWKTIIGSINLVKATSIQR
jgi:hypothetical protein